MLERSRLSRIGSQRLREHGPEPRMNRIWKYLATMLTFATLVGMTEATCAQSVIFLYVKIVVMSRLQHTSHLTLLTLNFHRKKKIQAIQQALFPDFEISTLCNFC